jgi:proteasome lid subunit RPN8/RPN11
MPRKSDFKKRFKFVVLFAVGQSQMARAINADTPDEACAILQRIYPGAERVAAYSQQELIA